MCYECVVKQALAHVDTDLAKVDMVQAFAPTCYACGGAVDIEAPNGVCDACEEKQDDDDDKHPGNPWRQRDRFRAATRRASRPVDPLPPVPAAPLAPPLRLLLDTKHSSTLGAPKSLIARLPIAPRTAPEPQECAVCLEDLEVTRPEARLTCMHTFHPECIVHALCTRKSCPTCSLVVAAY
jgi:hypothetical protein